MKRVLLAVLLIVSIVAAAPAQTVPDATAKRSDAILSRARQLDLLNHILPLVMTKDQIKQLLPAIEKCRAKVKQVIQREADNLKLVEIEIDRAYEDGVKKGAVPSKELLNKLNRLFIGFAILRDAAASENADDVLAVMKSALNEGQLKTASKSLDIKVYNPKAEPDKMSDDEKIKYFIRDVILDPLAYDLLVALSK
ncbi:MAG: hypothetical protein KF784_04265 [Fimbriimonadaceae bacterium]|nr:hypothetical protein [Fimbriimonadaceae bacterium]